MKAVAVLIGSMLALAACGQGNAVQDPRARAGQGGDLAWRVLAQSDGQAAFLARPGAAPDVVLWCRGGKSLTLRAHVFQRTGGQPNLRLVSSAGTAELENVRAQGGVRAGDRQLVEGRLSLTPNNRNILAKASTAMTLTSGQQTYSTQTPTTPDALPQFLRACVSAAP
ncbi:MAG: hypothetical protein RLZZ157_659 [Pseudomonadota bacterium]|jgi:hypothetical protein